MIRLTIGLALGAALAMPASAQDHMMHAMPGMEMPPPKPAAKAPPRKPAAKTPPTKKATPATRPNPPPRKAIARAAIPAVKLAKPVQHAHPPQPVATEMPGMDMPGHDAPDHDAPDHHMAAMPGMDMSSTAAPAGTALPAGNAPAPPPPADHYAARFFPAADIARAHERMMAEGGGQYFHQILFNLAEIQVREGRDGYHWDGEGWFGGDIHRLVIKSEGAGTFREGIDAAEAQALYSRAIGPYFNLQAGVRHDFAPSPTRTYATVGMEGLAPYMFETEAALFVSTKGDLLGRLEGWYDQRITQRLALQPRIELNLSAQDIPETRTGAGLSDAELGLRLRYEIAREFAPYIGLSYDAKTGRTADLARAHGEGPTTTSFVAGLRFWF